MDSSKEICAICLESTTEGHGQALFTAECSHIFHFNCIASNVQNGNLICPTCCATWQHLPFQVRPPHRRFNRHQQFTLQALEIFDDDEPLPSETGPTSTQVPQGQAEYVTLTALPEYPALIRSEKGDPFAVLLGITAPPLSDTAKSRAPLDLLAVLDVSGSMHGDKIRLLKQAVNFIIDNLGASDRLSIITFSERATRVTRLKRMTQEGRSQSTRAVNSIRIDGWTNIISGLKKAVQVLDQRRQRNPVTSIILLSDGQDNINGQGQSFLEALSLLPACIRSRNINNLSPQIDVIPVHTFGFGHDHDAIALHAIADGSGGTFSYIESIEIIQDAFAQCIGGLLSVVAQQVEINIQSGSPGVIIQTISSGRYRNVIDRDGRRHGVVYIENLYAEEEKKFLVYLFVPEEAEALTLTTRLIEVKCSYKDTLTNENVMSDTKTVDIRRPTREALSESEREVCLEVDREKNRVLVAQGIMEAHALAEIGDLESARSILTEQTATVLSSASSQSGDQNSNSLVFEMREILERMSSLETYETSGRAFALSRSSAHMTQRASSQAIIPTPQSATPTSVFSGTAFPQAMGYQTPAMKKMVTKSMAVRKSNSKDHDDIEEDDDGIW